MLATRCMLQAIYFCSGTQTEANFLHFGLAMDIYTHFTSPIRRYSGIVSFLSFPSHLSLYHIFHFEI